MAFGFKGYFERLEFNVPAWEAAFFKALEDQLKKAMVEFLLAAIPLVPVYTGMARGTFRPLGRFLNVQIPIDPVPGALSAHPTMGADAGEAFGQDFEFGTSEHGKPFVRFNIDLEYFKINELTPGPAWLKHPGPWHSFEAGRKAFREYLRNNLTINMPRIGKFVVRTRVPIR